MNGMEVDRTPVSLWRHHPVLDRDPMNLADAMIRWQREYEFDLVKFMPSGTYSVEDWGAVSEYQHSSNGTRTIVVPGVTSTDQWGKLKRLSPLSGRMGLELRALQCASEVLKDEVPILQTVFSPLTSAFKLAGEKVFDHLRQAPDAVDEGLAIITERTLGFVEESIRLGAHGIFFATQCATLNRLTPEEHLRFGARYDRMILDALKGKARYVMVHMHGSRVMFDQLQHYPANMWNWHDREGELSIAEGLGMFPGMVVGGISEHRTLASGSPTDIAHEVREAITQSLGRRLMIGPGCVLPIATNSEAIQDVVKACASQIAI
jgi:uroporphyrinogen decarboxylase